MECRGSEDFRPIVASAAWHYDGKQFVGVHPAFKVAPMVLERLLLHMHGRCLILIRLCPLCCCQLAGLARQERDLVVTFMDDLAYIMNSWLYRVNTGMDNRTGG